MANIFLFYLSSDNVVVVVVVVVVVLSVRCPRIIISYHFHTSGNPTIATEQRKVTRSFLAATQVNSFNNEFCDPDPKDQNQKRKSLDIKHSDKASTCLNYSFGSLQHGVYFLEDGVYKRKIPWADRRKS